MTGQNPPFEANVVAHVRDKIGDRPGFSIGKPRSDIHYISEMEPWLLESILAESPDDLAIRFIDNPDDGD